MIDDLACPFCRTGLTQETGALGCPDCGRAYSHEWGIPDFSTGDHYWNHLTGEQMEILLELTELHGYEFAVRKILGPFSDPYLVEYVLGGNRADFRSILPITRESRVLDLGAGWGAVSCGLAPACAEITSADTNPYTLRFIAMRARQGGLPNVRPIRIDALDTGRLPFAPDSFDTVLLNGVLEYVGSARTDLAPRDVQLLCLREVRRVLRPGGSIYVGIENRFGYLYFLGTRDHNGMRYTSVLPRALANLACRLRQGRSYRTLTHSYSGYTRLLDEAGFQLPRMYLAVPNYRDPKFIVPADDNHAIGYFLRRHTALLRRHRTGQLVDAVARHAPEGVTGSLARRLGDSFMIVAEARP